MLTIVMRITVLYSIHNHCYATRVDITCIISLCVTRTLLCIPIYHFRDASCTDLRLNSEVQYSMHDVTPSVVETRALPVLTLIQIKVLVIIIHHKYQGLLIIILVFSTIQI